MFEKSGFGSVRMFSSGDQAVFDGCCVRELWMSWLVVIMGINGLGGIILSSSLIAVTLIEVLCEEIEILDTGITIQSTPSSVPEVASSFGLV